jgi:hypothetical protein
MSTREVPASIGQRLLWFLEHYRPDSASLNCPVVCKLHGPLDADELEIALNRLTARHEALRTTIARRGRELVQEVHDPGDVELRRLELTDSSDSAEIDRAVHDAVTVELRTSIDIGRWPMRNTLWRLHDTEHVLCLDMHHLVSDAISCGIVMQDLIKLLEAGRDGTPELAPIGWQYPQYAEWQHMQLRGGKLRAHQDYWVQQLSGLELPKLPPPGSRTLDEGERPSAVEVAEIDAHAFLRLRDVAKAERTTPFAVMLCLYYGLLGRETGQSDLAVASLFANRSMPAVRSTVGFLANMVVLRAEVPARASLLGLLTDVRRTVVNAFIHESIPYQMLPIKFQDTAGRVDDVVFQMLLTPPPGTTVSARGVEFELYTPDSLGSRFTLELGLIPQPTGSCKAMLFYGRDRFEQGWAAEFLDTYVAIAGAAAADPSRPLAMS